MSNIKANVYINFQGKAREAMEFYKSVFGGNLTLLTFNPDGAPKEAGPNDNIMHAVLDSDVVTIMATDGMAEHPPTAGDNFAVSLMGSDEKRLTEIFNALSEGGNVKQSLKQESWGDTFAWLEDKNKVNWMIDITKE